MNEREMRERVLDILENGPRMRWYETHGMRTRRGACMMILAGFMQRINESSELVQSLIRYADQHHALDYDITDGERGALVELWTDSRWHVSVWNGDAIAPNVYAGDYIGANDYANEYVYNNSRVTPSTLTDNMVRTFREKVIREYRDNLRDEAFANNDQRASMAVYHARTVLAHESFDEDEPGYELLYKYVQEYLNT